MTAPPEEQPEPLPAPVRQRVVALAADVLGRLPPEQVPPTLHRIARFAPAKRARAGAVPIGAALETDQAFRERVAHAVREGLPAVAEALDRGIALPALAVEDVAAAAYLLRPDGWRGHIAAAHVPASSAADELAVRRLQDQLEALRGASRAEVDRLRAEQAEARREIVHLRRELREAREQARRAGVDSERRLQSALSEREVAARGRRAAEAEVRRLRSLLAEAEAAAETYRRGGRERRASADVRVRLLLDSVVDAAQGLRRELGLPPMSARPADLVAAEFAATVDEAPASARGRDADDPALLDDLLALPRVHLIVDGYNVTKTGYPTMPLDAQRTRLLGALAALQARTGAEVTCVFDGTDVIGVVGTVPRQVRVLFSPPGQSADELIRRLVGAEPPGRRIVVVSTDGEVAEGVRRLGGYPIRSATLLRLIERA